MATTRLSCAHSMHAHMLHCLKTVVTAHVLVCHCQFCHLEETRSVTVNFGFDMPTSGGEDYLIGAKREGLLSLAASNSRFEFVIRGMRDELSRLAIPMVVVTLDGGVPMDFLAPVSCSPHVLILLLYVLCVALGHGKI